MSIPTDSDPNQDGFEFAGDPEAPFADGAVLDETIPDDDTEQADLSGPADEG